MTAFDPAALLSSAREASGGLSDFGDPSFRDGLDALCHALNAAPLSGMGAGILQQKIGGQLLNRLRVEDFFRRHPEIAQERIEAPLVIAGLPRTGTTRLHRLLSRDARFRWMAFWESQFPVPFPGEAIERPEARIAEGHKLVEMMTGAMPKLLAIHPMAAEEADEEVMLMEHSFLSAFNAYAQIPQYTAWLDAQDQGPAYRYLKRMLQFLQWQKRRRGVTGQRWLLKSPHHLLRMDTLLREFPGVQVILTHRDPVQSIPSIASFIDTLWRIYGRDPAPHAAGAEWSTLMRRALDHTLKVRRTAPAQFLDVQFADTVKRPMEVVRRVYEFIGWPLTPEARTAMERWIAHDEKSHAGGHEYTPEEFGLSAAQLEKDFAAYRAACVQS
ncbi:MAG TPA: sulfotransferase [Candidatus Binatia bacterium]|nr:sulfotransferase [Candidatus Binatia bacterium]